MRCEAARDLHPRFLGSFDLTIKPEECFFARGLLNGLFDALCRTLPLLVTLPHSGHSLTGCRVPPYTPKEARQGGGRLPIKPK